ncbi:MAG: hypothetical protein ACK56F_31585 [bacterium]
MNSEQQGQPAMFAQRVRFGGIQQCLRSGCALGAAGGVYAPNALEQV